MADHKVAIQTKDRQYIGALENETIRVAPHAKEWETFEVLSQAGGKVAIKTFKGLFLSAREEKEPVKVKAVQQVREWELFTVIQHRSKVSFKTHHGNYLSASSAGVTLALSIGKNEKFQLISKDHMDKVHLKTRHGTFVGALENETIRLVPHAKAWELFDIDRVGEEKVSFKTFKGFFISAREDKEPVKVKAVHHAKEWEQFKVIPLDGRNKYAFKTFHKSYLAAHGQADKGMYLSNDLNNDCIFELMRS